MWFCLQWILELEWRCVIFEVMRPRTLLIHLNEIECLLCRTVSGIRSVLVRIMLPQMCFSGKKKCRVWIETTGLKWTVRPKSTLVDWAGSLQNTCACTWSLVHGLLWIMKCIPNSIHLPFLRMLSHVCKSGPPIGILFYFLTAAKKKTGNHGNLLTKDIGLWICRHTIPCTCQLLHILGLILMFLNVRDSCRLSIF